MRSRDIQRLEAKVGEYGMDFRFFLKDAQGVAVTSLAGTETVELWIQKAGGTAVKVGSGRVHDKATGELHASIQNSDVTNMVAGLYMAEVKIAGATSVLKTMDVELNIAPSRST